MAATISICAAASVPISREPLFIDRLLVYSIQLVDGWLRQQEVRRRVPGKSMTNILEKVGRLVMQPVYSELTLKQISQMTRVTEGSICRLFGDRVGLTECVQRYILSKVAEVTRRFIRDRGRNEVTLGAIAEKLEFSENELRFLFPTVQHLLDYVQRRRDWQDFVSPRTA